jgi:hypothetical protein
VSQRQQQQIAELAARLIVERGYVDWQLAKKKAATQLGFGPKTTLPKNSEIEAALATYQRTFGGQGLEQHLAALRQTAIEALTFFAQYSPLITGPTVETSATLHSRIEIHVFSDWSDAISVYLDDNQIPYQLQDKRYKTTQGDEEWLPAFSFLAGEIETLVTVFPENRRNQPPCSPVTGQAMTRWSKSQYHTSLATTR